MHKAQYLKDIAGKTERRKLCHHEPDDDMNQKTNFKTINWFR